MYYQKLFYEKYWTSELFFLMPTTNSLYLRVMSNMSSLLAGFHYSCGIELTLLYLKQDMCFVVTFTFSKDYSKSSHFSSS